MLAGCQWVPDTVNPFVEPKPEAKGEVLNTSTVPGQDEPYPNLASVPERPQANLSAVQRRRVLKGLEADRAHAAYSNEKSAGAVARQGTGPTVTAQPTQKVEEVTIPPPPGVEGTRMGALSFRPGSDVLPRDAPPLLESVANAWHTNGGRVSVVGYVGGSDKEAKVTNTAARLKLAAARAEAVARALVERGVPRDAIKTSASTVRGAGYEGHAGPDRAEIYLTE